MTIIMTFIGVVVFFLRLVTTGFKSAFTALWKFALTGFIIDCMIITLVYLAFHLNH